MLRIVEAYRKAGGTMPATSEAIAEWAITTGLHEGPRKWLARNLDRALAATTKPDAPGFPERVYCGVQQPDGAMLWDDSRTCTAAHGHAWAAQQRERIARRVKAA